MRASRPSHVVYRVDANQYERLIWRAEPFSGWFCIEIHSDKAVPFFRSLSDFDDLVASGLVREAEDPWQVPRAETALTDAQRGRRDQGWQLIRPLFEAQPQCFDSGCAPGCQPKSLVRRRRRPAASRSTA